MKRVLILLLCLLLFPLICQGEEETRLVFQDSFSAPADAEYLDFGDIKAHTLQGLESYLKQFPGLKKVDMFSTPVNSKDIAELESLFPQVEFGWTMLLRCNNPLHPDRTYHYFRTDALVISTLHNNQCLLHTSQDFAILKYCKNLLALDLGHNAIKDLSFLYAMPRLRVLILAANEIEDIAPIGSLQDLEYLEVFKNKVTDVSPLQGLTQLMDLNLCFNHITDYSPLTNLSSLQRLWLFNSNNYSDSSPVPAADVSMLKAALPSARVDAASYSTLGGWRTHNDQANGVMAPHYAVISEMFNTGVYIPFAESAPLEEINDGL